MLWKPKEEVNQEGRDQGKIVCSREVKADEVLG